jgi:hypothetical protein
MDGSKKMVCAGMGDYSMGHGRGIIKQAVF